MMSSSLYTSEEINVTLSGTVCYLLIIKLLAALSIHSSLLFVGCIATASTLQLLAGWYLDLVCQGSVLIWSSYRCHFSDVLLVIYALWWCVIHHSVYNHCVSYFWLIAAPKLGFHWFLTMGLPDLNLPQLELLASDRVTLISLLMVIYFVASVCTGGRYRFY